MTLKKWAGHVTFSVCHMTWEQLTGYVTFFVCHMTLEQWPGFVTFFVCHMTWEQWIARNGLPITKKYETKSNFHYGPLKQVLSQCTHTNP